MHVDTADAGQRAPGLAAAAAAIRRGQLVGLPLEGRYGLAADAFHERGIEALRAAKGRDDLAVPVMVPSIGTVAGIARIEGSARDLMLGFWPGPLTLVMRAQPTLAWSLTDAAGRIAVRLPLHPLALELLERTGPLGVVAAHAVPADQQVSAETSFPEDLAAHVAVLLDAGPLPRAIASAVIDLTGPLPMLVRPGPLTVADLQQACPDLVVPSAGTEVRAT